MKKLQKRYYILIFMLAIAAGFFLKFAQEDSFLIVKNSTAYAPERDVVLANLETKNDKVNLNDAELWELEKIDGIGEALAKRIIDYRTKNGKFEVKEDIMKVNGIGEKTYDEIKEQIYVE